MEGLNQKMSGNDRFLFYFAGHGVTVKMNGEFFKTCDTCRYNKRKQGQKNRDENKLKNKIKTYT
jgi:uncharacterized caspase-like protein